MVARNAAKPKTAAKPKAAKAKTDTAQVAPVSRAPGVPATEDNSPAPAYDPAPISEDGKSDPTKSVTGLPSGPAPMNTPGDVDR